MDQASTQLIIFYSKCLYLTEVLNYLIEIIQRDALMF